MDKAALADLTVLEFGSFITVPYCGKLLADLGANVIKIEPPDSGDVSRSHGPFPDDIPHPEKSGLFLYLNTNKRSVTLDINSPHGQQAFRDLIPTADVLLISQSPGFLDSLGLGYQVLREINPRLVLTSVTPFGHTGPYRNYKAHAINHFAASAVSHRIGRPDREPLAPGFSRTDYWSGIGAALSTMLAVQARDVVGHGQFVDFSEFECASTLQSGMMIGRMLHFGTIPARHGHRQVLAGFPWYIGRCKDGFMFVMTTSQRHWERFLAALDESWTKKPRYQDRIAMQFEYPDESEALLAPWLAQRTRQEVWDFCQKIKVPFQPILNIEESIHSEQLTARQFLQTIEHPVAGVLQYPGFPAKLSETPFCIRRPAPLLGQHNQEILGDQLGYTAEQIATLGDNVTELKESPTKLTTASPDTSLPTSTTHTSPGSKALAGVRVIDMGRIWSGPLAGQILADMGAEVIYVEMEGRRGTPQMDIPSGTTWDWLKYNNVGRNKLGITLNMTTSQGIQLFKDLVRISDVVITNLAPGTVERWGIDYPTLQTIKPDLIMATLTATGQSGPLKDLAAYGPGMNAVSGVDSTLGYEDSDELMANFEGDPDPVAGATTAFLILVALHFRTKTGRGQYIDFSFWENQTSQMGEAIMDYVMNDRIAKPQGHYHSRMSPHGNYPSNGDNQWVSIAVETEEEWQTLCDLMGNPNWTTDVNFLDASHRVRNRRELDSHIANWTRNYTNEELRDMLRTPK